MGTSSSAESWESIMKLFLCLAALLATAIGLHDSVIDVDSFTGFQVYRASPKDQSDASYLQTVRTLREHYDFWTEVRNSGPVDIMVPPGKQEQLESDLELKGISYEIMIPDVQKLIDLEKIAASSQSPPNPKHAMTWDAYHSLEDMYSYLDYLEESFDFVTTEVIGQSYEKRDMRVVSVCRGGCGEKKVVWIDGGIHAREWVSPAAISWMLKELVENDADHPDLTQGLDWYFVLLPTLMGTPSPGPITGCGGRRGLIMGGYYTARVWMPTEIGATTGTRAAHLVTNVLILITVHQPGLKWKMWQSATSSSGSSRRSSSTTPYIATVSSSSCPGDFRVRLLMTMIRCMN